MLSFLKCNMDHNILNKQKIKKMIEMILMLYVQFKVPIGCNEEFN